MDYGPAEQVAQAMAAQNRAYELLVEAQEKMKGADRLIRQLKDEYGRKFICGGGPYVIAGQGGTDKWPYNRAHLNGHENMPIIDKQEKRDTVPVMPGMRGESIMPKNLESFRKKLEEMNASDKPITFGKEIRVDDTVEVEAVKDECETQPEKMGGDCY